MSEDTAPKSAPTTEEEELLFAKQKSEPRFAVGLRVFLEFAVKNKVIRAAANTLGWQRPDFLMTSIPMLESRMVVASPGTEFVVRYLFDGTIFGFTTHLVHKQQDPFPMWVFHYPTVVEVKTLRRSPRINMTVPVKNADGRVFQSRDVSAHGALLAINGKIVIGNRLELSFNLPDGTVIENLGAEVVRVQESREETLAGVNFAESDHEQVNKIAAYLYSGKN